MYVLLSRTQAGPGRTVKQEHKEFSRNHLQTFILPSVRYGGKHEFNLLLLVRKEILLGLRLCDPSSWLPLAARAISGNPEPIFFPIPGRKSECQLTDSGGVVIVLIKEDKHSSHTAGQLRKDHYRQRWTKRLAPGCVKFLPVLAWLLLSKIDPPFSPSLYTTRVSR